MRKRKGSLTVEAVIIITFILFLLANFLEMGILLYQKSSNRECFNDLKSLDTVSKFYFIQEMEKIGEEVFENEF